MKLYVLRHGYSGEETDDDDPERKMTPEGREDIEALAAWMEKNGEVPLVVLSGASTRQTQTAEIIRKAFALPKVRVEDGLSARRGNAMAQVVRKVAADPTMKRVLMVSSHDTISEGLRTLDVIEHDVGFARIAMGELRILDVSRKDGSWKEKQRILPSDLGGEDLY